MTTIATRHRFDLSTVLLVVSSIGLLPLAAYYLIDHSLILSSLRSPIKRFVDQNFLTFAAIVGPSVSGFSICLLYKAFRWSSQNTTAGVGPSIVRVVTLVLLGLIGWMIEHAVYILWVVITTGDLQSTAWIPPVICGVLALSVEGFGKLPWLRSLTWGATAGAALELTYLYFIDFKVDLTI